MLPAVNKPQDFISTKKHIMCVHITTSTKAPQVKTNFECKHTNLEIQLTIQSMGLFSDLCSAYLRGIYSPSICFCALFVNISTKCLLRVRSKSFWFCFVLRTIKDA